VGVGVERDRIPSGGLQIMIHLEQTAWIEAGREGSSCDKPKSGTMMRILLSHVAFGIWEAVYWVVRKRWLGCAVGC